MPRSMRTVGVMSLMSLQVTPRYHGSLEAASSCEVVFDLPEAPLRTETRSMDRQMVINSFPFTSNCTPHFKWQLFLCSRESLWGTTLYPLSILPVIKVGTIAHSVLLWDLLISKIHRDMRPPAKLSYRSAIHKKSGFWVRRCMDLATNPRRSWGRSRASW